MHIECTCGDGSCMLCDDNGMQRHVKVSSDPNENWANDDIQFPRLLAELYATVGLDEAQWDDLCATTGLDRGQILEIFERADVVWQEIKEKTR